MATITDNVSKKKDVKVLKEILDRFGIDYVIEESAEDYVFSEEQIADFERTKQNYLNGMTTARNWKEVKADLDRVYP